MRFLILGLAFVHSIAFAIDFNVPDSVKQKYAALYATPTTPTPDGGLAFQKGRLFHRGGINVLSLRGDRFEMAFQHGRLLKKEIAEGAVPQSALFLERTVRNGLPHIPLVSGVIIRSFYRRISEGILNFGMENSGVDGNEFLQEAYGLAESTELPLQSILYGAVGPESLQVLLGERSRSGTSFGGASPAYCSAFAAWGGATKTGEMILGRNTDYPLNGYYDKAPTVIYFQPDQGQKFMAVTSAGIHNAGVVGLNEAGIYLGVHTIPTADVSADGMPVFFLAQYVLRNSHSLAEALDLFTRFHPPSGWSYMVVSTHEKKVASIELSNKNHGIRPSVGDFHVQTNHYLTEKMKPHYLHVNVSVDDDTFGRFERVRQRLAESRGRLDEREAISILSDKFDPYFKKNRGVGNVVAVHTTMTSAVVLPERGKLFVASGRAPVPMSTYVELPLVDKFSVENFAATSFEQIPNTWYAEQEPRLAAAEQEFIKAKIAFESKLDYKTAVRYMERAVELDGTNPAYHFNHAMLALKAGDFEIAKGALLRTVKHDTDHLRYAAKFFLGRLAGHDGDKKTAKRYFQAVLADAPEDRERKLRAAAEHSLNRVQGIRAYPLRTGSLALLLQEADVVEYP